MRIFAFNPSLQMASQSLRDCSDAAGLVSSIYGLTSSAMASQRPRRPTLGVPHIVHAEIVKRFGNLNLLLRIKKGIGKLLSFSQRRFDDLEVRYVAEKVANRFVRIAAGDVRILLSRDGSEAFVGYEERVRTERI